MPGRADHLHADHRRRDPGPLPVARRPGGGVPRRTPALPGPRARRSARRGRPVDRSRRRHRHAPHGDRVRRRERADGGLLAAACRSDDRGLRGAPRARARHAGAVDAAVRLQQGRHRAGSRTARHPRRIATCRVPQRGSQQRRRSAPGTSGTGTGSIERCALVGDAVDVGAHGVHRDDRRGGPGRAACCAMATSRTSGSSQVSHASRGSITGMRSWTGAIGSFGGTGDDRAGVQRSAPARRSGSFGTPHLPQAGEGERLAVGAVDEHRLLRF